MAKAWCPKCHSLLKPGRVIIHGHPIIQCSGKNCKVVFIPLPPKPELAGVAPDTVVVDEVAKDQRAQEEFNLPPPEVKP